MVRGERRRRLCCAIVLALGFAAFPLRPVPAVQLSLPPALAGPAPQIPGMAVLARGSDGNLWSQGWDGRTWGGWQPLGGPFASAPSITSWGPGRLDAFAVGADNAVWHGWYDGSTWAGWEWLGGASAFAPGAASWAAGRLDVFVRGADAALWHAWFNGSAWGGWEYLGGVLGSGPAAASWGAGRLDVFVQGADSALWHKWWAGAWSGWEWLGGALTAEPGAVSWGGDRIDVLVRGADNAAWHRWWDGSSWSGWEWLGGALTSAPAAAAWGPGQLDVFGGGADGALWHRRYGSRGWTAWEWLGGVLTSAPSATSWMAAANVVGGVPYHRQDYSLSCEEASLQMALGHVGIATSQAQILASMAIDRRRAYYSGSTLRWGDPYTSFVGDPSGSEVALTGYGTYFPTIADVASRYGDNVLRAGEGIPAGDVYRAVLQNHPVVAWISFDWRYHPPGSWLAFDGRWVQYQGPVEHTVTVVGVNRDSVYVLNPLSGPQWVSRASFEAAYATYHGMAVVLQ